MPPAQHDPLAEYKVHEIRVLAKHSDAATARQMLEHVAKQVQPIMRRRLWRVPLLTEFSPRQPNLMGLNVNRGQEIKIRLRPPGTGDGAFYSEHHVLKVMLHELTHIVHGPHMAPFYKLLDELTAEYEELSAKGVYGTGQGFDARSEGRLGTHSFIPQHNPPEHLMRDAALKAAEARARKQSLFPTGPRRVGGTAAAPGLSPAEAAARAAERRARDRVWCGSAGDENGAGGEAQGAQQQQEEAEEEQEQQQEGQQQQQQEREEAGQQQSGEQGQEEAARIRDEWEAHLQRQRGARRERETVLAAVAAAESAAAAAAAAEAAAVAAAAERREALQQRQNGGTGSAGGSAKLEQSNGGLVGAGAAAAGGEEVVDLTGLADEDDPVIEGSRGGGSSSDRAIVPPAAGGAEAGLLHWVLPSGAPGCPCCAPAPRPGQWACPQCTYANDWHHLQCELCLGERPLRGL